MVAATFGSSHHYLRADQIEERFGLLVAVNSVESHRIRSIDKDTFDAIAKKSREQAIREAETSEFGLDVEQDLLRGVTGTPADQQLGTRLTGKDSLRATGAFDLRGLRQKARLYIERFQATIYRQNYPWIDNIREVKNTQDKETLDGILEAKLVSSEWENIWLAAPDIIDWQRTAGFSYTFGRPRDVIYDMHLSTATRQLAGVPPTLEVLRRKHVQALNLDDVEVERWPLYRCLHAEVEHEGHVYLLSNGRWFRGDPDFVQSVNRATEAVPIVDIGLPLFSLDDRVEADYNSRVASLQPDRFACLDRRPIMFGGGRSRVEACDLYSAESDFIHVKRYSGSSDLSHLFAQGVVAGESFARSHEYREAVRSLLPVRLRFTPVRNHLTRDQFRVIYAVISQSEGRLRLPFFARLNLKRAHEVLSSLGFGVALVDIKVAKEKSTLRRSRKVRKVF